MSASSPIRLRLWTTPEGYGSMPETYLSLGESNPYQMSNDRLLIAVTKSPEEHRLPAPGESWDMELRRVPTDEADAT